MGRSNGGMRSPGTQAQLFVAAVSFMVACCRASPLPSNVTSADSGLKKGSCSIGDVVYLPGDEFQGTDPCERCACAAGSVQCTKQRCEPRPGCKALHRPDHCCPTYQCECEQDGRLYGNGEKLVDPVDPCRVCYCQGGEVVCRRIACFMRDDCRPRHVPGRCCPEYDNCPLRGVTTMAGLISSVSSNEDVVTSPSTPKKNVKQEFIIKEITPVSEIPVITDMKIKKILPAPTMEVGEYSSSKSPLIPREATSETSLNKEDVSNIDIPMLVDMTATTLSSSSTASPFTEQAKIKDVVQTKSIDSVLSKISFSNDAIKPELSSSQNSDVLKVETSVIPNIVSTTTKAPIVEEEDTSLFDHNPAFPPQPDDLSVLSNHDDEIIPEQTDNIHISSTNNDVIHVVTSTENHVIKELPSVVTESSTYDKLGDTSSSISTVQVTSSVSPIIKESPMLNLRSAIPTELLNAPSHIPEEITGESDDVTASSSPDVFSTNLAETKIDDTIHKTADLSRDKMASTLGFEDAGSSAVNFSFTTLSPIKEKELQESTTNSIAKSNLATEVTSRTELSSLPIETSDQNPQETMENSKDNSSSTLTHTPITQDVITTEKITDDSGTEKWERNFNAENRSFENIETTEFILTSFGSLETSTDAVELIKHSPDTIEKAALKEPNENHKSNVLTDLINIVGDVASIGDNTEEPNLNQGSNSMNIAESEELIPVNTGYKSKNNNRNFNSITEIPQKNKNQVSGNKQKVVEIEDEESGLITDNPPPNDKVEPTTKRPIIDNVSDDHPLDNKTEMKDIEIINKSYVPTINKRPNKLTENSESHISDATTITTTPLTVPSEMTTEYTPLSSETTSFSNAFSSTELVDSFVDARGRSNADIK